MNIFLRVKEDLFLSVFPDIRSDRHYEFGSAVLKIDRTTWPEVMGQTDRSDWSESLLLCFYQWSS